MRFLAIRGTVNTPVSGNAELQSLRILATLASWLEREGVTPISRDANRYTFRAGYARLSYHRDFILAITSGEINISQAGNQQVIVYRIYFDELALVIFGMCAVFGVLTLGSILKTLFIISLCIFLISASITTIRFHISLLSCLKQASV